MGVDLGLEGLQLRLAQIHFLFPHRGHQLLDAQDHVLKGVGQLLHLTSAAYRAVGKVVGVGLKALHGVGQSPQGMAQQPEEQPAGKHSGGQHHHRQQAGQVDHFRNIPVDHLVHVAYAHHTPIAVLDAVDAVDDGVRHVGAVLQRGQGLGVLGLQSGVQQLLLGVVDDIALPVHEEAVAPLADADVVDVAGNAGKAQVQGEPGRLALLGKGGGHSDHPGVVALKDGLYVGGGHVGGVGGLGGSQIKGEVLKNLLLGLVPRGPAFQQLPLGGVAGDGHHVGAEL